MIVICPDCKKKNDIPKNEKKQCKRCLQVLVMKKGVITAVPKELV